MRSSSLAELKKDIETSAWQEKSLWDGLSFKILEGEPLTVDEGGFTVITPERVHVFTEENVVAKDGEFDSEDQRVVYYIIINRGEQLLLNVILHR